MKAYTCIHCGREFHTLNTDFLAEHMETEHGIARPVAVVPPPSPAQIARAGFVGDSLEEMTGDCVNTSVERLGALEAQVAGMVEANQIADAAIVALSNRVSVLESQIVALDALTAPTAPVEPTPEPPQATEPPAQ